MRCILLFSVFLWLWDHLPTGKLAGLYMYIRDAKPCTIPQGEKQLNNKLNFMSVKKAEIQ